MDAVTDEPVEFLDAEPVAPAEDELAPPPSGSRWRWLVVAGSLAVVVAGAVVAREASGGSASDGSAASASRTFPASPVLVSGGALPALRSEVPFPERRVGTPELVCEQTSCLRTGFVPVDVVEAVFEVFPHVELGHRYSILATDRRLIARHLVGKVDGAALVIDVAPIPPGRQPSGHAVTDVHEVRAVVYSGPYRIVVRVADPRLGPSRVLRLALDTRLVATI